MSNKRFVYIYVLIILVILGVVAFREDWFGLRQNDPIPAEQSNAATFEECAAAGLPIMESYPRQCRVPDGRVFSEEIGNELDKTDLIVIDSPRPNTTVRKKISISGRARGTWYFEASFPVLLLDENEKELAGSIATAQGEWMTEAFVPFTSTLNVSTAFSGKAWLVLKKDNPSGEARFDDELRLPLIIE